MQEIYEFARSINETDGKQRVSEYAYSGTVDCEGNFKLSGYAGCIYSAELIKTAISSKREEVTNMSIKSQQVNMKAIHSLVSQDLGYIFGERESGPNGAKKLFHTKSAAFLRALAKDLGFAEYKVTNNHGGIAVSGEITLRGMWGKDNGLYLQIFQSLTQRQEFVYNHIKSMKDNAASRNLWASCALFANGEYEHFMDMLLELRKLPEAVRHVA